MKTRRTRLVTFYTEEEQFKNLDRYARALENASVSWVIREAIAEYLVRHAGERRSGNWMGREGRGGTGKTPPRILLHLRDRKRLKLLRLQAQAFKGTHRTAGRVIRAAIDEYLEAHAEERREALRKKRIKFGDEWFLLWKQRVEGGPAGEEKISKRRRAR